MGRIGFPEIIFIALAVVLLFGANKLPEIGRALGQAIKEFRKAGREITSSINDITEDKGDDKKG